MPTYVPACILEKISISWKNDFLIVYGYSIATQSLFMWHTGIRICQIQMNSYHIQSW